MYEKRGIPVIAILVFLAIMTCLHLWIRPLCLDTCDDNNYCTSDYCSKDTNYLCVHTPLNGPQTGCSAEVNCGVKTCKDGLCDANYKNDCCGNKKCETGEVYTSCEEDCASCDDKNECTKDSYDYNLQKCINEIIKPCCGNGICDKGAETNVDCSKDCPNCDDKNESTTDSFNYITQKCENPLTYYFTDDFEQGTSNWVFTDAEGQHTSNGWNTKLEEDNTVLRGVGHSWASLNAGPWEDYALELRFKVVKGSINFNYRINTEETLTRYTVWIDNDRVSLTKNVGETYMNDLVWKDILLGDSWHKLEIKGYYNIINVYVDNKIMFEYKDNSNPILSGKVAFETLYPDPEFLIDDLKIKPVREGGVSSKIDSLFLDTYKT